MVDIIAKILDAFFRFWDRRGRSERELEAFYRQIQVLFDFSKRFIPDLVSDVNKLMEERFGDQYNSNILIPPMISLKELNRYLDLVSSKLSAEQHAGVNGLKTIVDLYSVKLRIFQFKETQDSESALGCLNALVALYYTSSRMLELKERFFIDGIKEEPLRDKVLMALRYRIQKDRRPFIVSL